MSTFRSIILAVASIVAYCYLEIWSMTLNFKRDLEIIQVKKRAKYVGQSLLTL